MGQYTGDSVYGRITYILRDTDFPLGIKPGYCIFSFEPARDIPFVEEMVVGELKTANPFFTDVGDGFKRFECRDYTDRDFQVGQVWKLREYEL
jgi:hypothetical protein